MSSSITGQKRFYPSAQSDSPSAKKQASNQITLNIGGREFSFNRSTFEQERLKQTAFEVYAQSRWAPQQDSPVLDGNAETFEKFIVPYINDHITPNWAEITLREDFNSLISDIKAFQLTSLFHGLKNQDIKSLAEANWSENFPMPQTLSKEDKKEWPLLPIEKKIQTILEIIGEKDSYNDHEYKILEECWIKSMECSSAKKILEVRRACLKRMPKSFRQKEEEPIVFKCKKEEEPVVSDYKKEEEPVVFECQKERNVIKPRFYKDVLAKESSYIGSEFFKDKDEVCIEQFDKDTFEKLLDIWSGDSEIASIQEIFDLLEICDHLALEIKSFKGFILDAIKTWDPDHADDAENFLALATYPPGVFNLIQGIKDNLIKPLIQIYLNAYRNGDTKQAKYLKTLSKLDIITLDLKNNAQFDDKALQNLTNHCSSLNSLFLSNNNNISNKSAAHIATLTNLTSLKVNRCENMINQAIEQITALTNLKSLKVSRCKNVTDRSMKHIAKLTQLTNLSINACEIRDLGMKHVVKLTNLTNLDVSRGLLTDRSMEHIATLPNLTSLDVSRWGDRLADQAMEHIAKLTSLTSLNVSLSGMRDRDIGQIVRLTNLTSLDVSGYFLTHRSMEHIAMLTSLTSLDARWWYRLTDQGMKHIANLANLTNLNVSDSQVTDQGIEQIAGLTNLTSLDVSCCEKVTAQTMVHIANLANLTNLNVSSCYSMNLHQALEQITKLPNLTSLDVSSCYGLTKQAIEQIEKLPNLTSLNVSSCYWLTKQAIEQIEKLTHLTSLTRFS